MQGYGYSVWAVPMNHEAIRVAYGMKHIPHITLSTNHVKVPIPTNWGQKLSIEFKDKHLYRLPRIYEYDPLDTTSAGFYCKIEGYDNPLLHMTMSYDFSEKYGEYSAPDETLTAHVYRADTRSLDPSKWIFF